MSVVKYKGLEFNAKTQTQDYRDTILLPIVSTSGPSTSYIYQTSDFYSKYNCSKEIGDLVDRLIDLNYKVLVYRLNYVDEYSAIKIIDKNTYTYFDVNKSYQGLSGTFTSIKNLSGKSPVWSFDILKFVPQILDPMLNDLNYGVLIFPELSTIIRIFGGSKPSGVDDMSRYDKKYNIEHAFDKNVDELTHELAEILFSHLAAKVEITEEKLIAQFGDSIIITANMPDFLKKELELAYDYAYSNDLETKGLRFKSKNPDSTNDIRLTIEGQSDTEYMLRVDRIRISESVYSEAIYVDTEEGSGHELKDIKSELIEYLDGELSPEMKGTYTLGYHSPSEYDVYSIRNEFKLDSEFTDPIFAIVNPIKWDLNFNQNKIEVYITKLTQLADSLTSVVLSSDPYFYGANRQSNLIIVNPNVVDNVGSLTLEVLLKNLSQNRMESDVDFNGRLDGDPVTEGQNVATLLYDQYKYTFNQPSVYFQHKWITLSTYCGFVSASNFIGYYLDVNAIAKLREIDTEDLRSTLLNKYTGLISDVVFDGQKSGRRYTLSVSLYFKTQTSQKLILIVNLSEE